MNIERKIPVTEIFALLKSGYPPSAVAEICHVTLGDVQKCTSMRDRLTKADSLIKHYAKTHGLPIPAAPQLKKSMGASWSTSTEEPGFATLTRFILASGLGLQHALDATGKSKEELSHYLKKDWGYVFE